MEAMYKYFILGMIISALVAGVAVPQNAHKQLEGIKPYVPTRLKWLAVELNAESTEDISYGHSFAMSFKPNESENAICIPRVAKVRR